MKLSVSSYSFNQYVREGKMTQFDCVQKAADMGFDAIEFTDIAGANLAEQLENAKKIRQKAEEIGIEISAYSISADLYRETWTKVEKDVERLKNQLRVAKALGARIMRHDVIHALGKTGKARSFDAMLPMIAENCKRVTEYAADLGIMTCTENHGFIAQDSDRLERLFNGVAHDNYGLLVDMGNFLCADEDPVKAVSRLAPYAIHAHAKDMAFSSTPQPGYTLETRGCNHLKCCALGEGCVPVEQCVRILAKAGFDGYVSIEYEGAEDCIQGISKGAAVLRDVFSRL